MKKNYFLAAIAALALASCATSEPIDDSQSTSEEANAIGFGTFLDRAPQGAAEATPKAAVLDLNGLKANDVGFKVIAYHAGSTDWENFGASTIPNFMNNVAVTWNNSSWTYSPTKYWPKLSESTWGKVSFFGYSNVAGATGAGQTGDNPKITFDTQETASAQVDLVADAVIGATGGANNPVKFEFDHILSKIGFAAKLANQFPGATVTVTSLKVYYKDGKVKKNGIYTFHNTENKSIYNWEDNWEFMANQTYFADSNSTGGDALFSTTAQLNNETTPSAYDLTGSNYLMLIPQTLAAGDVFVKLVYTVATTDPNLTVTNTSLIPLPYIMWLPGMAYTYTFSITLNPVVFDTDISVNGWENDSTQPDDVAIGS
jgi:hypothetical protein